MKKVIFILASIIFCLVALVGVSTYLDSKDEKSREAFPNKSDTRLGYRMQGLED